MKPNECYTSSLNVYMLVHKKAEGKIINKFFLAYWKNIALVVCKRYCQYSVDGEVLLNEI